MSFVPATSEESGVVEILKGRLIGEYPDLETNPNFSATTVLRFYRGHKGNADHAYEGLKRYIQWRIEEDVDNIDAKMELFKAEHAKNKVVGPIMDSIGRPANFVFAHRHNSSERDINEMKLYTIWTIEQARKASKPDEERFVIVFDLGKFTLKCMDYEVIKMLIGILQTHYPDTLESVFVVDSPMIFSACWVVIKPWLDPVTAQKVAFVKRIDLVKHFDPAVIPSNV
jgi:hypothetical protein